MTSKKRTCSGGMPGKPVRDAFVRQVLEAGSRKDVAKLVCREAEYVLGAKKVWAVIYPPEGAKPLLMTSGSLKRQEVPVDDLAKWIGEKQGVLAVLPGKNMRLRELPPRGLPWRVFKGVKQIAQRYQKSLAWLGPGSEKAVAVFASLDPPSAQVRAAAKSGETVLVACFSDWHEGCEAALHAFLLVARMAVGMTAQKKRLEKRLHQTSSIAEIAQNINAILDLNILMRLIVLEVTNAMRCQAGDIWMLGDSSAELVCKTSLGLSAELRGRQLAPEYTAKVAQSGEAIWVENLQDDKAIDASVPQDAGFVSMAVVPLKIKNNLVGVMHLYAKKRRGFSSEERLLLKTLLNQATTAIENANLFEETRQRAQELLALYEVAQVISEVSNLDHALERIVDRVSEVLNVEKCWFMFWDEKRQVLAAHPAAVGYYEEQLEAMELAAGEKGVSTRVFQNAREFLTNTAEQEPLVEAEFKRQFKLRNLLAVPLRGREETFGVFLAANKKGGNIFRGNDVRLFRTMASETTVIMQNARLYSKLTNSYQSVIHVITGMIDAREPYTRGHSERVAAYCELIARRLQLDEKQIEQIRLAGLMHDIGKIGVSEDILLKTEGLSPDEQKEMEKHSEIGAQILAPVVLPWDIRDMVLSHHEAFNGTGFPGGLSGEAIPMGAKIIAVADAFDVATTWVGRDMKMTPKKGFEKILRGAGSQFDPAVVKAFEMAWPELQALVEAGRVTET